MTNSTNAVTLANGSVLKSLKSFGDLKSLCRKGIAVLFPFSFLLEVGGRFHS